MLCALFQSRLCLIYDLIAAKQSARFGGYLFFIFAMCVRFFFLSFGLCVSACARCSCTPSLPEYLNSTYKQRASQAKVILYVQNAWVVFIVCFSSSSPQIWIAINNCQFFGCCFSCFFFHFFCLHFVRAFHFGFDFSIVLLNFNYSQTLTITYSPSRGNFQLL